MSGVQFDEPLVIMKTKFILLFTAVISLGSLSSCVVPYGGGYGYNNYYPWYGGFGGYGIYNNYYSRPGYAYGGYRGPYYGRPGFTGYRPGGFGGYHGGFAHSGGFGGFHGGGFAGHHR